MLNSRQGTLHTGKLLLGGHSRKPLQWTLFLHVQVPIANDQYYYQRSLYSWFAATWQEGHVGVDTKNTFFVELVMKMEFSPQRGEKCFCSWPYVTCKPAIELGFLHNSIKCCFGHWLLAIGNLAYGTHCHDLLVWPPKNNSPVRNCWWRHGNHVGGQEQKHFSLLGTKLYFYVKFFKRKFCFFFFTPSMAAFSHGWHCPKQPSWNQLYI